MAMNATRDASAWRGRGGDCKRTRGGGARERRAGLSSSGRDGRADADPAPTFTERCTGAGRGIGGRRRFPQARR
eukprot:3064558-Pyramimonas_sp.AAC.1